MLYYKMSLALLQSFVSEIKANNAEMKKSTDDITTIKSQILLMNEYIKELKDFDEQQVVAEQDKRFLLDAINTMPPICRKVFVLRKLEGLTHSEIAAQLHISKNTVENHLTKGMKLCREYILANYPQREALARVELVS